MARLDLGTFLSDDSLALDNVPSEKHPKGKTYRVPSPSAKFALQLRRMMEVWGSRDTDRDPSPDDITELLELVTGADGQPIDFQRRLLGDVYDEMIEDGITGERLHQIGNLLLAYYGLGEHVAQAIIASPGESPARPNRASRRATGPKTAGSRSPKASTATTGSARATTSRTSRSSTSAKPRAARNVS